jgi:uncharacterized membrane protein
MKLTLGSAPQSVYDPLAMDSQSLRRVARTWLLPFSILLGAHLTLAVIVLWIDTGGEMGSLWERFLDPNPNTAQDMLGNSAEVVAAVLGIAITVVAIIVELAANRYTHRITELFVREPMNLVIMGFFVVTALMSVVVGYTFDLDGENASSFAPRVAVLVSSGMLCMSLLLLLPYFAFVFDFLNPLQIVDRIREHAIDVIAGRRPIQFRQQEAIRGVEQLADVGLNAMEHKDKAVSMASVDALRGMVMDYQPVRNQLPEAFFRVEGELSHNPDFVSMSPEVLALVTRRRIWFEMKILRKYQTLYNEALNKERDICYLVAINTRLIAERALETGHDELYALTIKFFNTYLRATINAKDVRTAYNVLNQYRLLAEKALPYDEGARSIEIANYFKYYGVVSFNAGLAFVLETVAYDLCALNEYAFDKQSTALNALLAIFLQVDKESETAVQEVSLRGVRKAQVKLATHFLLAGDEAHARLVFHDMADERVERLASIRSELLRVDSPEFWEISDRGRNFDYLPPAQKELLRTFFGWFGTLPDIDEAPRDSRTDQVPQPMSEAVGVSSGGVVDDTPPGTPLDEKLAKG